MAKVLYVLDKFPNPTENFILREILALRKLGIEIRICALRRPSGSIADGAAAIPENPAGFSEAGGKNAEPIAPADALTRRLEAEGLTDEWMRTVEDLLAKSASLEDFRDRLIDLYRDMDPADLGNMLQRAMTLADLSGRFDAAQR